MSHYDETYINDEAFARYATGEATPQVTNSAFNLISRDEFRQALDEAISERSLSIREAITVRRARRNPRVFDRLYEQVVPKIPANIYGAVGGFDFQAFLDWLVENLPAILEALSKLLPLLLLI